MTPEFARIKLAALLQQPPHGALLPEPERERAAAMLRGVLLGEQESPEAARRAAELASATDPARFPSSAAGITADSGWTLTHPLSRHQPYQMAPLPADPHDIDAAVQAAARDLADRAGPDPVIRYLAAWRWLPDAIREQERAVPRLGGLWDVLPADPRLPDRTVWDHLGVTAALAGAGSRPAFLVFALGPVQGFIAQARSTRDLWIGSYLVSYLSWSAIRAIAEEVGPDALLYPSLRGQPLVDDWLAHQGVPVSPHLTSSPSPSRAVAAFPNKLLALVPDSRARDLGELASAAVRDAWAELGRQANVWLAHTTGPSWQPTSWDVQLARHVETAWVALSWPEPGQEPFWLDHVRPRLGNGLDGFEQSLGAMRRVGQIKSGPGLYYGPAHGLAQRAFDARKLARQFGPASEPGFKCVLCGERATALGADDRYGEQRARWRDLADRLVRPDLLAPNGDDRLCAVCLTRRVAPETAAIKRALGTALTGFPSTSTLATLPFRRALLGQLRDAADGEGMGGALAPFLDALVALERHGRALGTRVRIEPETLPGDDWALDGVPADRRGPVDKIRRFDGEWLLLETYERKRAELERGGGATPDARVALEAAEGALTHLLDASRRAGLPTPSAYYAILVLDGDRMGRWVTGEQHAVTLGDVLHPDVRASLAGDADWRAALTQRRLFEPATHATLGAILRDFALWVVPRVVEREHGGRVVYAGGDDVLALLPADRALGVVDALRARYASAFLARDQLGRLQHLPRAAGPDLTVFRGMGPDATVSAGLLYAHHLLPLGLALEEARRLEHEAKGTGGRDAVAIGVARRSGPDDELELTSKHRLDGRTVGELVATARELLRGRPGTQDAERSAASHRLPYLLRDAAPILDGLVDRVARRRAIVAVAGRHVAGEESRQRLLSLYDALAASSPARPIDELARLFRLARFLEAET